jgi:hypothetical protein
MKIIIAGGRDFNDYNKLCQFCDKILSEQTEVEIVSGTANGADKLGEKYANDNGHPIKQFPADWDKFGKSAGYKRNAQMAEYADALIAFWDGKSRGTKHMIDLAKRAKLKVRISYF